MEAWELFLPLLDRANHEAALFAATGFLVLGIGDIAVDIIWIKNSLRSRLKKQHDATKITAAERDNRPVGALAIFVPAWDESAVIGRMLRHSLTTLQHDEYRIYVGCYPNDRASIAEVQWVGDPRVRIVIGKEAGPTTKAACLGILWKAMLADELAEGWQFKAVILHDAEDVVHPGELMVFADLIDRYDLIQLPVVPIIHPGSRWISGHYADEFAEAHSKELAVRQSLDASIPSAGVGCAFSRGILEKLAEEGGGSPFNASSLTEDYELGLKIRAIGGTQIFAPLTSTPGEEQACTRGYFPASIDEAINQKSRWMTGIALAGWDRLGWSGGFAERWMRLRDRQSLLAALLLFCGYSSFAAWVFLQASGAAGWFRPAPLPETLALALKINSGLLLWRLAMRFGFVTKLHGPQQGLYSIPRMIVGNYIAIRAGWRAVGRYRALRNTGVLDWGKTAHAFPQGHGR